MEVAEQKEEVSEEETEHRVGMTDCRKEESMSTSSLNDVVDDPEPSTSSSQDRVVGTSPGVVETEPSTSGRQDGVVGTEVVETEPSTSGSQDRVVDTSPEVAETEPSTSGSQDRMVDNSPEVVETEKYGVCYSPQPSTSGTQSQNHLDTNKDHSVAGGSQDQGEECGHSENGIADSNSGEKEEENGNVADENIEQNESDVDEDEGGEEEEDEDDEVEEDDENDDNNSDGETSPKKDDKSTRSMSFEAIEVCKCDGKCPECPLIPHPKKSLKRSNKETCLCGEKCCKEAMRQMYEDSIKRMMKCIKLRDILGDEFDKFYKIFENMPPLAREFLTQYPVYNKDDVFSIHHLTQQVEVHCPSKTLVSLAAATGVRDAVQFFVNECNADVNFNGSFQKGPLVGTNLIPTEPPLFHAALHGHLDVVKYLVQAGADVNYSSQGQSILFLACCRSLNLDIIKFLMENDAKINCIPLGGVKCLQEILTTVVIRQFHGPEIFKIIVDHMEYVDERDEMGKTALHTAVQRQELEAMKILIEKGADINKTTLDCEKITHEEVCSECDEQEEVTQNKSRKRKRSCDDDDYAEMDVADEGDKVKLSEENETLHVCSSLGNGKGENSPSSSKEDNSNCILDRSEKSVNSDSNKRCSLCGVSIPSSLDNDGDRRKGAKRHISAFESKDLHPVVFSAYKDNEAIVTYLASLDVPKEEVANAYEVLGAEKAIFESYNSAVDSWVKAAQIRAGSESGSIEKKNLSLPSEILNYETEKSTIEEIENLRGNSLKINTQAVLVLERVVDYKDQDTLKALGRLAGDYLEMNNLSEFIKITLDIHERYMLNSVDIMSWSCKELLNHWLMLFTSVDHMESVSFDEMLAVCKSVRKHLQIYLKDHAYRDPILFDLIDWGESTDIMLYLLLFIECICVHPYVSKENFDELETFVEDLLRSNYRDGQRKTFLHVAVMDKVFGIEGEEYYLVNNDQMACFLIDLGADVNASDKEGNRPLHLVYSVMAKLTDEKRLECYGQFADVLLGHGAHPDVLNCKGESCIDLSQSTDVPLEHVSHTTLQCLAAGAIIKHEIPYRGEVPSHVEDWIKYHMVPPS